MRRRVIFMVLAALFVASQLSYAGVIDSYVTNLGNSESTYNHDSYVGNWWTSDRDGNNASYWYVNYMPGNGSGTTWTYLQVALPSYTGNILDATLYIDVTASSSGNSALLYHTLDSSLATGDAMQGLTGNQLVQTINNPALGWLGLDVTSFILNDYSNSYGWAAFEFAPAGGNVLNSTFTFSIAEPQHPRDSRQCALPENHYRRSSRTGNAAAVRAGRHRVTAPGAQGVATRSPAQSQHSARAA